MPLIIKDLHNSKAFLRWEEARNRHQLRRRHSLPHGKDQTWVMISVGAGDADRAALRDLDAQRGTHRADVPLRRLQQGRDLASLYAGKRSARAKARSAAPGHRHARDQRASQGRRLRRRDAGAHRGHESDRGAAVIEGAQLKAVLAWYPITTHRCRAACGRARLPASAPSAGRT